MVRSAPAATSSRVGVGGGEADHAHARRPRGLHARPARPRTPRTPPAAPGAGGPPASHLRIGLAQHDVVGGDHDVEVPQEPADRRAARSASQREAEVPTARGTPAPGQRREERGHAAHRPAGRGPQPGRARACAAPGGGLAPLMRRSAAAGSPPRPGRPMVSRQCSGSAGSVPSSASSARHAWRWCAPLSMQHAVHVEDGGGGYHRDARVRTRVEAIGATRWGRTFGSAALLNAGAQKWPPHSPKSADNRFGGGGHFNLYSGASRWNVSRAARAYSRGFHLRGLLRGDAAAEHELAVARAHELVAELAPPRRREVGQDAPTAPRRARS